MYDENSAVAFINRSLLDNQGVTYDADEILNVIDIIWDYYDDHNLLDIDNDDDLDTDDLIASVAKVVAADKQSPILPEHIAPIVTAEIEYENSIEDED